MKYIVLPAKKKEFAYCQCGCKGADCSCNNGTKYYIQ